MGIAAGAGLCFLGYCIYFDKKRRSDPNFKQKLRESKLSPRSTWQQLKNNLNTFISDAMHDVNDTCLDVTK